MKTSHRAKAKCSKCKQWVSWLEIEYVGETKLCFDCYKKYVVGDGIKVKE